MAGWDPWGVLLQRRHLSLEWAPITGANAIISDMGNGQRCITLDARLARRERRAVLAHELVHDERDILFPPGIPGQVIAKEEALVDAEVARRLVPPDELEAFVRQRVLDNGTVEWRDVAERWDVPRDVAERAMRQLEQGARRRHPTSR